MFHNYQTQECPHLDGRIMMLPKKSEIEARFITSLPIESGIFNHPVVILSKQVYNGKVAVFVVTSFGGTPIENRHKDSVRRNSYLPIRPASHPDTSYALIIAHGKVMKKQSFVNIKEIHEIPSIVLRPCWRDNDLHLERASYQLLASELWKKQVGELAVRLKGHGIFERVAQPTYSEVPVSVFDRYPCQGYVQQLDRGTSFTRTFSSPISGSYGTFTQYSTEAIQPYTSTPAPITTTAATTADAARVHNYPVGAHQGRQPRLARPNHIIPRQSRYSTEQRPYNQVNNDTSGPGWLVVITIVSIFIAGGYYFANNIGVD